MRSDSEVMFCIFSGLLLTAVKVMNVVQEYVQD